MRRLALAAALLAALCGPAAPALNVPGGGQLLAPITGGGGGGGSGVQNPAISNLTAVPGSITATVTWTTALATATACSVKYGTTSAYGSSATDSAPAALTHSVALSSLTVSTTYHYQASCTYSGYTVASVDATFATTAAAGIAYIQGKASQGGSGNNVTSSSVTLTSAVGSGHAVFVFGGNYNTDTVAPTSVTDDKSNVYTIFATSVGPSGTTHWLAYKFNVTNGPQTITMNYHSIGNYPLVMADEFSGVSALDGTPGTGNVSNCSLQTNVVLSITTTSTNDLIWTPMQDYSGGSIIPSGYTAAQTNAGGATGSGPKSAYKTAAAAGAQSATWTAAGQQCFWGFILGAH